MQIMISGGYRKSNPDVYNLITKKKRKIAYVPAWFAQESRYDLKRFQGQFGPEEVIEIKPFYLDKMFSEEDLFSYDVIYLDGGNTFFILHHLKRLGLLKKLKAFAKKKILVGMSAGSLVQTPNINLAGIPRFDRDDKVCRVTNDALSLTSFEVFPHFDNDQATFKSLVRYSKTHNRKIYLLPDGSSLIKTSKLEIIGPYLILHKGKLQ